MVKPKPSIASIQMRIYNYRNQLSGLDGTLNIYILNVKMEKFHSGNGKIHSVCFY